MTQLVALALALSLCATLALKFGTLALKGYFRLFAPEVAISAKTNFKGWDAMSKVEEGKR